MKKCALLFTALLSLLLLPSAHAAGTKEKESTYDRVMRTETIRCAYVSWPPYFYQDYDNGGKQTGIVYDLMNAIGELLDLKIEWTEEVGWGNIGEGFATGRYDMACALMWPDAPKFKNFMLTIPVYYSALYPWVRADDTRFDGNLALLNSPDIKFSVIDGAMSYNLARSAFPQAETIGVPPMAQNAEWIMNITTGKADVMITDYDEIRNFLEQNPGKLRQVKDVPPVKIYPMVLGVPKNEPMMHQMINNALRFSIDNGLMEELKEKYGTHYMLPKKNYTMETP
ncbi:MAG: transporter substrate-binding domain-containing protein [Alphaproteobacteria bacterium]|nr:transporter substrate-binding domain-containing protein [Alphaproteobacteria bacterium]